MMRRRFALPLLVALLGAAPAPSASPFLGSDEVLLRYAKTLLAVPQPKVLSFQYNVEQAGAGRNLVQSHRVYRSGALERDETLSVDGRNVSPPLVRISRNRLDRYAVRKLAPTADRYIFDFVTVRRNARHYDYVFRAVAKTPAAFEVTYVTIDGARFLPNSIAFTTSAGKVRSSGSISFNRVDEYWVPTAATAVANVGVEEQARERITFWGYRFPVSLPRSTFSVPRPLRTPVAGAGVKP